MTNAAAPACPACNGTGIDETDGYDGTCQACLGTGRELPPPTWRDAAKVVGFWLTLVGFAWAVAMMMEGK